MDRGFVIDTKYKIEAPVGGGSFSEVFLVSDLKGSTGRSALKLLRKGLSGDANSEAVTDFKHEFEILKDLNHPNIARILDFGYDRNLKQYYYTTELVEGEGVYEATNGKSVDEVLELFVQALRAFHYLHSYRVFHFDVKAANLLVTRETKAIKVIDFGLASIDPRGKMIGTPAYMAPEIIAKERPDGRADLYSLGVLFYYCFTRQNPFRGKGVPETLRNQQTLVPPPASSFREGFPAYLDRILAKLLEKNPANRYQRAEEILREINFYSPKKFALETRETLLSYLPEEGRLIGRKKEQELFERSFEKVFSPSSSENLVLMLVFGDRGTGKSRLLKEFKYYSQLHGVAAASASVRNAEELSGWLDDFRIHLSEGQPTVFLLDDVDAWAETDETYQQFRGVMARLLFSDPIDRLPLFWVGSAASSESLPASFRDLLPKEGVAALTIGPFDPKELREYIVSLTGLEDPPTKLIAGLEARTDGNPSLVTELLRSLIEEGALFDRAGRWKKTTFEDLGIDFSKARFSGVLEELLFARYEKLQPSLKTVMEGLSLARKLRPAEISRLLDLPDPAPLLEELLARDLVARDDSGGRYAIRNATLADLIDQKLSDKRRHELHDRAASLFPEGSEARLYHEMRGSDVPRAFELCRKQADRFLKEARGREAADVLRFALDLDVERSADQDVELHLKLGEACLISLEYRTALDTLGQAEKILSGLKDRMENVHGQVDALLRIGAVYLKMNEIEKSSASLSAALGLLHYLKGDRVRELVAENYRGAILVQEGQYEAAKELFEKTRARWEQELSAEEKKKVTNNDLGVVYLITQRYPQALRYFREDLDLHQAMGDQLLLARTHYNLGQTYLGLKELPAAVEHYQLCANFAQQLKNTELLLRAYNGLGNTFNLMEKPEDAVRYYERGLDLCERTGDLRSHAAILVNIGIIEASQGHWDKAIRHLDPAIAFLRSLKNRFAIDRQVLVRALLEIGDIAIKQKQWKGAEDALREALRMSEDDDVMRPLRFWVLFSLAELFEAKGEKEELRKIIPEIKKAAQTSEEMAKVSEISDKLPKPVPPQTLSTTREREGGHMKDSYRYILEINKFINAESDLPFVLKSVLNYALELSQAESGAILLRDEDGRLKIAVSRNLPETDPITDISLSVAKRAIESGEPLLAHDATKDPSLGAEKSVMRLDLKSVLCLPVKSKRRTIGALYLDNRLLSGVFEHVDLEVLKAFADQAGIAIENARLLSTQEASRRSLEEKMTEMSSQLEHYQSLVQSGVAVPQTKYDYQNIIARSKRMVEIFRLMDKITDTDLAVFIHGESGTGKELIARALHVNSGRSGKRFVAINCGALPANLIECELFGHRAGAFTGATRDKKGLFEEAHGGTIFLDEVAELDLPLQSKLLRVAQEGEFYRVGDSQPIKCDVRIVSASNKDIEKLSREGKFREDLYYRLCQIRLDLPPLRERREDIPSLVDHFIRQEHGASMKVSSRLLRAFLEYDWPGNIRELENVMKVAIALSEDGVIDARAIPSNYGISKYLTRPLKIPEEKASHKPSPAVEGLPSIDSQNRLDPAKSWYDYEKTILAKAYRLNGFNAKETAEMLDLAIATVYKKIKEIGLSQKDHPLYADTFHYERGKTLKDYLKPVFEAALAYSKNKPYTAIAQLKVSQGYFYNVIKGKT